ncbi:MAG: type II secretion system protein M [Burkholderiales bacterium]|nr:MAG: type II secretion system protein M [Burkholderiales bacterium]
MNGALGARWQALAPRERRMVSAAAIVLALGVGYALLFEPAWQGRQFLQRELPQLRSELASMDAMAGEARGLSSQVSAAIRPDQMRQAVEGSLARAGLSSALVQMGSVGEALELRLGDAPFAAILEWLAAAQRELRVRPVRVEVARQASGRVTARVELDLPRGEPSR